MSNASNYPNSRPWGLGCAYVTGGWEKGRSAKLLRAAFDAGIRHYDTAPMYGHGTSEGVLGEALAKERSHISIATKVGIPRPKLSLRTKVIRTVASPIRKYLPNLSKKSAAAMYRSSPRTDFSLEAVRSSVESSLRNLKTDYVDILLLHEPKRSDITDELLRYLSDLKTRGAVLLVGLGGQADDIAAIDADYPDTFDVYQRSWSVLQLDEDRFAGKVNIFHRAILNAIETFRSQLVSDPAFGQHMREVCGSDLADNEEMACVLLGMAVAANPNGSVLFGSRRIARIDHYARLDAASPWISRGAKNLRAYREFNKH